jgi:hypothetical protein
MEIALNQNELIHLYLKENITEVNIRHLIIKYKEEAEYIETYNYHINKWNHIVGEYYYCKDNQGPQFSYIWFNLTGPPPDERFWIVPDKLHSFFQITYTSYQSWDMLFKIIQSLKMSKDVMIEDDYLYSILSRKLAYAMAAA